jgi:hypothetical protein
MKLASNIATFTGALIAAPIAGQITVANASQFESANLSQALTAYIAGQPSPDLEQVLDEMFPPVEAGRFFEFQKHNDEAFITETDDSDIRPVNAAFKKVEYSGSKQTSKVINKGLTYRQDHDGVMRDGKGKLRPGWEKAVADNLRKRLIRAEILRGIALLNAAAVSANYTWNAASNPDGDLRSMARLGLVASGLDRTHLLIGDLAWMYRQDAYEASTRDNEMANHSEYTEEDLARYLGINKVRREKSLYQTKKGAAKTDILAALAYLYNAEEGQLLDDPSNIKRVWSPTDDGPRFAVYVDQKRKFTDVTVEHYSTFISPITSGIRKGVIANA